MYRVTTMITQKYTHRLDAFALINTALPAVQDPQTDRAIVEAMGQFKTCL